MASAAILAALLAHAKEVEVRVTGKARLTVRITDDGRKTGRSKTLSVALALARACGLSVAIATRQSTIVSIVYAHRRSTSG